MGVPMGLFDFAADIGKKVFGIGDADAAEKNETPRCKQRGIYFASKIYSVASHGEFNPRTRLKRTLKQTIQA